MCINDWSVNQIHKVVVTQTCACVGRNMVINHLSEILWSLNFYVCKFGM